MKNRRSFLFLQGVCSPFFARLADRLKADGHHVYKVNFNVGDCAYWGRRSSWCFRGDVAQLRDFYDQKYRQYGITDQIMFGDRRPVHRPAAEHAESCGVRTHVYEEGYFRPFWVTLEREGVNGHSMLPRDPDWFWQVGKHLPDCDNGLPFKSSFALRAAHDVVYHGASAGNALLFPHYRTHAPVNAAVEYAGYSYRLPMLRLHKIKDQIIVKSLINSAHSYYVLPLQLSSDAQIRDHSPFENMQEVIEFVMRSFAEHAPSALRLIIKNHPLDMGLVNYSKFIAKLAGQFDVRGRVDYLETGDLNVLVKHAAGMVTVNSTAGSVALAANCPTIALSDPIYNLPGLTFQGKLDDFWQQTEPPDTELFRRFRNTVIHTTQVNGGFYTSQGIDMAIENSMPMLEAEYSPLESLLWQKPY